MLSVPASEGEHVRPASCTSAMERAMQVLFCAFDCSAACLTELNAADAAFTQPGKAVLMTSACITASSTSTVGEHPKLLGSVQKAYKFVRSLEHCRARFMLEAVTSADLVLSTPAAVSVPGI